MHAQAPRCAQFRTCRVSAISVGDKVNAAQVAKVRLNYKSACNRPLPITQVPGDVKFNYFDAEGNMQDISVEDLTKGKKVKLAWKP